MKLVQIKIIFIISMILVNCKKLNINNKHIEIKNFTSRKINDSITEYKSNNRGFIIEKKTRHNSIVELLLKKRITKIPTVKYQIIKDSLFVYFYKKKHFKLTAKGLCKIIEEDNGLRIKGWLKSVNKDEYSYLDGYIFTDLGAPNQQFISVNKDKTINNEQSFYYLIESSNKECINIIYNQSIVDIPVKENSKISTQLKIIDSNNIILDSIKIKNGKNCILKSFLNKPFSKSYIEVEYLDIYDKKNYMSMKFDTLIVLPIELENKL